MKMKMRMKRKTRKSKPLAMTAIIVRAAYGLVS